MWEKLSSGSFYSAILATSPLQTLFKNMYIFIVCLFIYLYFWLCCFFVAVHGLCLVEVSRAYSLVADPRLYEVWVSAVTERGLCSMDSVLEAHGLVAP